VSSQTFLNVKDIELDNCYYTTSGAPVFSALFFSKLEEVPTGARNDSSLARSTNRYNH
jgi:hypothetical protein